MSTVKVSELSSGQLLIVGTKNRVLARSAVVLYAILDAKWSKALEIIPSVESFRTATLFWINKAEAFRVSGSVVLHEFWLPHRIPCLVVDFA